MTALRVYVAGASAEVDMCAEFIERLRDTDVEITHDWTMSVRANGGAAEASMPTVDRMAMATADFAGVAAADVLWILVPACTTIGAWVELGYAKGLGIPIIASGEHSRRTIFTEFCRRFATHEEALRHLVERNATLLAEVA